MKRVTWATRIRTIKTWVVFQPDEGKILSWHRFKKDADKWREGLRDVVVVELAGTYAMPRHLYEVHGTGQLP